MGRDEIHLPVSFFLFKIFIFCTGLKVTLHLQLLQNVGYTARVVRYILAPVLHPVVCTSHSPPLYRRNGRDVMTGALEDPQLLAFSSTKLEILLRRFGICH